MFESLAEQIRVDQQSQTTSRERAVLAITIAVVSVILFGALYYGLQLLS
jgi:hypothetical protein